MMRARIFFCSFANKLIQKPNRAADQDDIFALK